jgi:hypothetical protein
MDERHDRNPRVMNVAYAVAVARHSAVAWDDAALPHDYAVIGELLGLTPDDVKQRVMDVACKAAGESTWYGVTQIIHLPDTLPS